MSLTSSMDEADMEVAGIYRKFKTDSPLAVRMEEIASTPPPKGKPLPKTGLLLYSCFEATFFRVSVETTTQFLNIL